MPELDPFDIIARHDPANDPTLARTPDDDTLAAITLEAPGLRRRAVVRRRILIAAAIVLTLASIAAAWYVASRPVRSLAVTCYGEVSLDADRHGTVSFTDSPSAQDCEPAWKNGFLQNPNVSPGSVPALTACVTDNEVLAVFPTDDPTTCEQLGLSSRLPDRPSDRLGSVSAAQEQITEFIQSARCHSIEATASTVQRILLANNLSDWEVERQPDNPDRPCGTVAYDLPGRKVVIVPHASVP